MRKAIGSVITIGVLAGLAFYGQAKLNLLPKPCSRPITYSLGGFDSQFKIPEAQFLDNIDKAVQIWETAAGKDLFKYDPAGKLKINLVYDYRQEATDKLKSLGYSISNTENSYESLKFRYSQMLSDYNQLKASLDAQIASYNQQKQSYEEQVNTWNSRGGAPKSVVNQLNAQRDQLNTQASRINSDQKTLNSLANDINAMVDVLNRIASSLNLNVKTYNTIGASRGDEFEEGAYIVQGGSRKIEIYEFEDENRLIRVLAHEMGHALGLEHIDGDPQAIMYRLNQGQNEKATVADIAAIKQLCGIN